MARLIILLALALGVPSLSAIASETSVESVDAKDFSVDKDGQKVSFVCDGGHVTVNSNNNTVTLTGKCVNVVVNGNKNTVTANAKVRRFMLNGNKNTVTWSAKHNKKKPQVVSPGNKNSVKKAD